MPFVLVEADTHEITDGSVDHVKLVVRKVHRLDLLLGRLPNASLKHKFDKLGRLDRIKPPPEMTKRG